MDSTPLTRLVLETAAFVAIASLLIAAVGWLAARCARRSAPLRHGLLLATLTLLLMLPGVPFAATLIDADSLPMVRWLSDYVSTDGTIADVLAEPVPPVAAVNDRVSGATGSSHPISLRTLTANEIPAGAVLPGQRTAGLNPAARAAVHGWSINGNSLGFAIVIAWLLGTLVSLLRTLRGARRVAGIVRRSPQVADGAVVAIHETLARQLGLRRAPALRNSAGIGVPFAWGLWKPVIVLPESLADAGQAVRLRPILLHELAHVRRRDAWVGLLQRCTAALYWWNPLVHRLNARLAEARELICDAHVLAGGCPPRDYAEVLVELAAQVALPQPAAALGLVSRSQPQLTRRVKHLLEDPPMFTSLRWFGRLCVMALIIVGTTAVVLIAAANFHHNHMSQVYQTWNPRTVSQPAIRDSFPPAPQIAVPAAQPAAELFAADLEPAAEPVFPTMEADAIAEPNPFLVPEIAANEPSPEINLFGSDEAFNAPIEDLYDPGTPGAGDAEADTGPTPNPNSPPTGGPRFIGQGSINALAAIDLVAGEDGVLKEVRWFTESLGTGEEAFVKLGERLKAFAETQPSTVFKLEPRQSSNGTIYVAVPMQASASRGAWASGATQPVEPMSGFGNNAPYYNPTPTPAQHSAPAEKTPVPFDCVLAAQVTASPQLRYEHVARVIALCEAHVERVIIGQLDMTPDLKLTLGFVRDGAGNKISSSPVLIWNQAVVFRPVLQSVVVDGRPSTQTRMEKVTIADKIVEVHSLPPLLMNWRQTLEEGGHHAPKNLTALIRADDGVDAALVEQVVQAVLPAGIERVVLEPLATPAAEPANVQAVITEVKELATGTHVWISVGADDGVKLGASFFYRVPPYVPHPVDWMDAKGELVVTQIGLDTSECRIKRMTAPPEVGFQVTTQGRVASQAPTVDTEPVVEPAAPVAPVQPAEPIPVIGESST